MWDLMFMGSLIFLERIRSVRGLYGLHMQDFKVPYDHIYQVPTDLASAKVNYSLLEEGSKNVFLDPHHNISSNKAVLRTKDLIFTERELCLRR